MLALKPASYSVKRMKASAWQKAVNEDQDNDVLHAIDSAKRRIAEPVKDKISKPQRLQREEKKRDRLSDEKSKSNKKLNRQENKLNENHDKYKQRKKRKPKNKKTKKTVAERFKSAFKFVKNVYEKEVKKFFAAIAVPILIIFLVFAFIIMIFSSIVSGGGLLSALMRRRTMTFPKLKSITRSLFITSIRKYLKSAILLIGKKV